MIFFNNMIKEKLFMKNFAQTVLIKIFMTVKVISIKPISKRRNNMNWLFIWNKVSLSKATWIWKNLHLLSTGLNLFTPSIPVTEPKSIILPRFRLSIMIFYSLRSRWIIPSIPRKKSPMQTSSIILSFFVSSIRQSLKLQG